MDRKGKEKQDVLVFETTVDFLFFGLLLTHLDPALEDTGKGLEEQVNPREAVG